MRAEQRGRKMETRSSEARRRLELRCNRAGGVTGQDGSAIPHCIRSAVDAPLDAEDR